ncbi:serine peptidase, partial [Klebsiella pneumoniae]
MTTKLINLPHLADMVFGVPHYVTRQTMDSVKAVLIPRIQGITEDAAIQMALNPGKSPSAEQVQPTGGVAVI